MEIKEEVYYIAQCRAEDIDSWKNSSSNSSLEEAFASRKRLQTRFIFMQWQVIKEVIVTTREVVG